MLGADPIRFASARVERDGERVTISGALTLAGQTRPASYDLELAADGRLTGRLSLRQTEFQIKPFRGLIGALKVRDDVEIVLDVTLPR